MPDEKKTIYVIRDAQYAAYYKLCIAGEDCSQWVCVGHATPFTSRLAAEQRIEKDKIIHAIVEEREE